ncbi:MAG: LAGLIDADG family homing endonuclease [Nitrososphaerota archaeon]
MVSMSISKEGERQKYLPLEIRAKIYDDVIELRKQGLSYTQIQRKIYEKYGRRISLSQICFWLNKKHHPLGKVNKFDDKSSSELAYIIGTILSDGNIYFGDKNCILRLAVKDYEFAEEFGRCLAKVLGRKEPYKPFWSRKQKLWVVEGYSILLYKFLDRPFEELKPYIEHSKKTISAFIRALFDGEGSMRKYKRQLELYNTNKELLSYTQYLLKRCFDIDTTGPYLASKAGTIRYFPNSVITKTTKDNYYLRIRTNSLLNFYKYIGFTIKRKKQRLIKAVQQ